MLDGRVQLESEEANKADLHAMMRAAAGKEPIKILRWTAQTRGCLR
jgi:hypothetical protein